ncbi:hypothetical protein HZH66_003484 [Vespula vulgaris]|uniref:Uncharacterized protein n=1 Tax=Vespula vulgaris TaxID=7454 RepID=A0A834KD77_VESVU|nr:hypothetical protein HZH66_003484 [Vespula vulgaris]
MFYVDPWCAQQGVLWPHITLKGSETGPLPHDRITVHHLIRSNVIINITCSVRFKSSDRQMLRGTYYDRPLIRFTVITFYNNNDV